MENSKITEAELHEWIQKLDLPPIILEIYNEKVSDPVFREELGYDYSKPYSILDLSPNEQEHYELDRYKPILEIRGSTILAFDTHRNGFILYSLEENIEEPNCFTWDGAFLDEVSFWFENEMSEEDIFHLGNLLNLKYTEEIIESLSEAEENDELSTFEEKDEWMEKVIKELKLRID